VAPFRPRFRAAMTAPKRSKSRSGRKTPRAPRIKATGLNRRQRRMAVGFGVVVLLIIGVAVVNFGSSPQRHKVPVPAPVVAVIPPAPRLESPEIVAIPPPEAAPPSARPQSAALQPAWLRYAVPGLETHAPRIAIVIDDCGLDRLRTERAIALPAPVTLSFLAYSEDLPRQTAAARRNGHELLVHVPMEPLNEHIDMGPNGLALSQPREEVLRRLRWDLDRFDGYVGINNHMGSRFTANAQAMFWVAGELKTRGLMFLDSRTVANTKGELAASVADVPYVGRDVFLDDDQKATAVAARLKEAEAVARRKGTAIAIGHPHDGTLAALNAWIAELPRSGIVLVPLTDIVKARTAVE
jgi:uncharacterized protein